MISETFNYVFDSKNKEDLLRFAENSEQELSLSLFFDFLGINTGYLDNVLDKSAPLRQRRISYFGIFFTFNPRIRRAEDIMINFCSEKSIKDNRKNIINYFFTCYDFIDYSLAVRCYDSILLHYYEDTFSLPDFYFEKDEYCHITFDKNINKENLKNFLDENWDFIIDKRELKKCKMNSKILSKIFIEHLIDAKFSPKIILKILDTVFSEDSALAGQLSTILSEEDIRIYKYNLKQTYENDWFNLAHQFIENIRCNNPKKYQQMIEGKKYFNLIFNEENQNFSLVENIE